VALFPRKATKPAVQRLAKDESTHLRHKYDLYYRHFDGQDGPWVYLDGQRFLMAASNDYLGLGDHPQVMEAAIQAIREWGTSPTGSRLANGSRRYHTQLEEEMADYLGVEACHVHAAGYLSCMSAVTGFMTRGDNTYVDRNVHSCLWDGLRLSLASIERFAHNQPADLERVIKETQDDAPGFLVQEGVYSMEGHEAPLDRFAEIVRKYRLFWILDDAHGFGVTGQGRGTAAAFNLQKEVDIVCGSFSKALNSTGGFVAGSKQCIEFMRTHGKQTIFSAALSPSQAAAALASLRLLRSEPQFNQRLWENTRRYHQLLDNLGLDRWDSSTPATPIVLGTKEKAWRFWKRLIEKGVFSVMIVAPGVPPGKDLIRTAVSARWNDAAFALLEEALVYAKKGV